MVRVKKKNQKKIIKKKSINTRQSIHVYIIKLVSVYWDYNKHSAKL